MVNFSADARQSSDDASDFSTTGFGAGSGAAGAAGVAGADAAVFSKEMLLKTSSFST